MPKSAIKHDSERIPLNALPYMLLSEALFQ
jgi:hypothetical protein